MTCLDIIQTRTRQINLAWMILTTLLLVALAVAIGYSNYLRDELAKPPRLTYVQKHEVISEYHEHMDNETKWALRKIIGCTDKE